MASVTMRSASPSSFPCQFTQFLSYVRGAEGASVAAKWRVRSRNRFGANRRPPRSWSKAFEKLVDLALHDSPTSGHQPHYEQHNREHKQHVDERAKRIGPHDAEEPRDK